VLSWVSFDKGRYLIQSKFINLPLLKYSNFFFLQKNTQFLISIRTNQPDHKFSSYWIMIEL
jgi:hypothetical protein